MKAIRYLMIIVGLGITGVNLSGCTMLYHDRTKVLIPDVDINQTLKVAEMELEQNKVGSVLTLWAMRDQVLTPEQAKKVSDLYFKYIDRIDSDQQKAHGFSVWHLTWAISNMYREGDEKVKAALKEAYVDAAVRVDTLDSKVASTFFYDDVTMGDAHIGGRAYAESHIVAPGNPKYLQSVDEYKASREAD